MSCIVRISIHDDEIVSTTVKYEIRLVIVLLRLLAQNTTAFRGSFYILDPPRGPKVFHHAYMICRFRLKRNGILSPISEATRCRMS